MSNRPTLQQSLHALTQAEPPAALDNRIMGTVGKLLALENYYKADTLLNSQYAKLDAQTRYNLQNGMDALKAQYGREFEADYSHFAALQRAAQTEVKPDEPEQGRG